MKNLKLNEEKKIILPLYYNFVTYRKLDSTNFHFEPPYSKKYMSYVNISAPTMLVSKIIDYSKIE